MERKETLVEITEKTEGLDLIDIREVSYSLTDCLTSEEARRRISEAIREKAPRGSSGYKVLEMQTNRPIGLAIAGQPPLVFIHKVEFYSQRSP